MNFGGLGWAGGGSGVDVGIFWMPKEGREAFRLWLFLVVWFSIFVCLFFVVGVGGGEEGGSQLGFMGRGIFLFCKEGGIFLSVLLFSFLFFFLFSNFFGVVFCSVGWC